MQAFNFLQESQKISIFDHCNLTKLPKTLQNNKAAQHVCLFTLLISMASPLYGKYRNDTKYAERHILGKNSVYPDQVVLKGAV